MSLLLDAPPLVCGALGVVEALEALPVGELSLVELSAALRAVAGVRGRLDALEVRCLAAFERGGGPVAEGATNASAWLAAASKSSARDAHRVVKRAAVIDALPALGDALAAGAVSAAHVDVLASVLPAGLWAQAGELVDVAVLVSPEELRLRAQRFVADRDGDRGRRVMSGSKPGSR